MAALGAGLGHQHLIEPGQEELVPPLHLGRRGVQVSQVVVRAVVLHRERAGVVAPAGGRHREAAGAGVVEVGALPPAAVDPQAAFTTEFLSTGVLDNQ